MRRPKLLSCGRLVCTFGGAHKYLERVLTYLRLQGFDITAALPADPDLSGLAHRLTRAGVDVHHIPWDDATPSAMVPIMDRLLSETDPDIVHFNDGSSTMREVVLGMNMLKHHRARRVLTMHLPLLPPTTPPECTPFRDRLPLGWRWRKDRRIRRYVSLMDKVISVSQLHADVLRRRRWLPEQAIEVIPNGVDAELFRPVADDSRPVRTHVLIGSSGNLVQMKRFDLLIAATEIVAQRHPAKLVIAGSGPLENELRQLIRTRGLDDLVHLAGYQANVAAFLQSLDVFAMSSENEGLPYAQLEAMAVGLPSVVTEVGDLPYVVRGGTDGFVVRSGDISALAEKLSLLVADGPLRRRMGASARAHACETYAESTALRRTGLCFRDLCVKELKGEAIGNRMNSRPASGAVSG